MPESPFGSPHLRLAHLLPSPFAVGTVSRPDTRVLLSTSLRIILSKNLHLNASSLASPGASYGLRGLLGVQPDLEVGSPGTAMGALELVSIGCQNYF